MTPEQTDATREAARRAKAWDDHLRAKLVYEELTLEPKELPHGRTRQPE